MHFRAWGRRLLHMNEYARQFGLRLASEHLDLVDEHIAELLLVLDEEVCEALYIRGTCNTYQPRLASIHIELSAPLTQDSFRLRPDPLKGMTRPLTELPVIRVQRPLQDLLRLLVCNAHRHEVLEVVESPFARPRILVHGFPDDP
jgi:hypothetical protein